MEVTASPAGAPYAHDVAHYNRRLTCAQNVMRVVGRGACAVLTATREQYLPGTGAHAECATSPCAGGVARTAGSAGKQASRKLGVYLPLQNNSPPCPPAHRLVLRLTTGPSVKTALLWPLPRAGTAGDPCVIDVSQRAPTADKDDLLHRTESPHRLLLEAWAYPDGVLASFSTLRDDGIGVFFFAATSAGFSTLPTDGDDFLLFLFGSRGHDLGVRGGFWRLGAATTPWGRALVVDRGIPLIFLPPPPPPHPVACLPLFSLPSFVPV